MSANQLSPTEAFTAGDELWVIENNTSLKWWHKLDFASGYLLTQNYLHKKQSPHPALVKILEVTHLQVQKIPKPPPYCLLGTADHFQNKWLLVWNRMSPTDLANEISRLSEKLAFTKVRFFSHSQALTQELIARPTASSLSISFIENT